ncbi:ubiquitin 3 binding protein But2 C-terminal domain-containing protein [Lipomyces chichibuensis]|uniref:ubiquitin 3 binding protein But2 C-terminal domain-containing protein n=1 Tax=Lipomyces chichibuensis TaxID=1546026 RepID=UPI00334336A1
MYAKFASLLVPALVALPSVFASTCKWPSASFSLTDEEGTLGQISDGQVRTGYLGQIYDGQVRTGNGTTCLTLVGASNGTLSDIFGRPCYVTPYYQFECTAALQPNANPFGFCASGGLLTYNGSTTFYACDTGVDKQKNIYVKDISSPACTAVNLTLEAAFCAPPATCQAATVYETATSVKSVVATVTAPTTVYVTTVAPSFSTVIAPTTIHVTSVESEFSTVVLATTIYATETVTALGSTVVKPVSVTATATTTETETITKATTVTESATVTVTAVGSTILTPTTLYATKTETETKTATATVSKLFTATVTATAVVTETATVVTTKEIVTTVVVESSVAVPTTIVVESSVVVPTTIVVPTTATAIVTETPKTTPTSSTCVPSTSLYPNLIIPINSAQPNTALGTGYWANLTKSSTEEQDVLLQFDVASKYTGTCELKFMFPDSPVTFPFFLEGDTTIDVYALTSQLTESATWNNHPSVGELVDTVTLTRGQDTFVKGTTCASGSFQGYLLKCTGNCVIEYFIDYNPPPVGTVLLPCE